MCRRSTFWVALAFAIVAACGGQATGDDPDAAEPMAPDASDSGSGRAAASGNTPLGPCMPGFNPADEPGNPCNWLAEGLCYDTKVAACSCVCPRNKKNSTCSSGFFQEDGRTTVVCY